LQEEIEERARKRRNGRLASPRLRMPKSVAAKLQVGFED